MKKYFRIVLLVLLLMSLTACQPTPQKDIVVGKSLDKMIQKATDAEVTGTVTEQEEKIAETMGAKDTYIKELANGKGNLKIHVNADVWVPDVSGISIQRVEKTKFTQDQVDILLKYLIKGEPISGDDYKLSKDEITLQINKLQGILDNVPEKLPPYYNGMNDWWRSDVTANLDKLKEQLKTASDKPTMIPSSRKLEPVKEMYTDGTPWKTGEGLYALAQSAEMGYESLRIYNYDMNDSNSVEYVSEENGFDADMGWYFTKEIVESAVAKESKSFHFTEEDTAKIRDLTITKEEAKKKAEELLSAMGIDYMTCFSEEQAYGGSEQMALDCTDYLNSRRWVWLLRYTRAVEGIPLTFTYRDCIKIEDEQQSAPWAYEAMTFVINDNGIVGFKWYSPYKVTGTVTEKSNVLSFDECMKVFDTMSLVANGWNTDQGDMEFQVNHIRFGMTRVTEQNKRDSGLLVPVWDFFANTKITSVIDGATTTTDLGEDVLLTINAIDGSVINRSLGY